ncbi:HAD-IA family hydrolase [Chamaesiphon sp. OTE_20_metabat_361]|uniref:HAD-IA family hydrolase n=1 Tax=Chamaesiphon sp. OTE_20_metabat_361 TaxID=2964689 RepID=UPI00286CF604|nr:HAD-IA family hydrolase [Chamaesiphon sp. OTE_20_metabat_361]
MTQLKAVIFGAIGTIVETSDIQRQAFNAAFTEAGLDWHWDIPTYHQLLNTNGGQNRIRAYRDAEPVRTGVTDEAIAKLHHSKTKHFVDLLANTPLSPRPGVVELLDTCHKANLQVAFCTSTSKENVEGIREALAQLLPFDRFATIVTLDDIGQPKPAPDAYIYCLQQLGITADEAIAIEDTPVSLLAAQTADLVTIATPGAAFGDRDFCDANLTLSDLTNLTVENLSSLLADRWHQASYFSV